MESLMKKIIGVVLIGVTLSANAAMWTLVKDQFVTNKWYCTYKLEGSNPPITKTIQSSMPCQHAIFEN
jgi:hypothetical protein